MNLDSRYYYVAGMEYPFWVVSNGIAHNRDSGTDMGDLTVAEFQEYFKGRWRPINEDEFTDGRSFTERFREEVGSRPSWGLLAGICMTSIPTVKRWYAGTAAPHRVGRASVFAALQREYRRSEDSAGS